MNLLPRLTNDLPCIDSSPEATPPDLTQRFVASGNQPRRTRGRGGWRIEHF